MTENGALQFIAFLAVTAALAWPLGVYLSRVLSGAWVGANLILGPAERALYAILGLRSDSPQSWRQYAFSLLLFNALGFLLLYAILRLQNILPWNPLGCPGLSADLAFNAAVSFVTNTDWQAFGGETALSPFSQMMGLTVQNFLSAATGLAVAAAVARSLSRRDSGNIGNFYVDVTRITLYVLLPLSLFFAVFLIGQGVPDTLATTARAVTLEGAPQSIAMGPIASQVAIKELGSNGGGYFNVNSAHPYENPTALTGLAQIVAIVLLPVALVIAFGRMVGDRRQGWSLLASMTILFLILFAVCWNAEADGNPAFAVLGVDQTASPESPGGNMEGKEARFGIFASSLWATATTATSNGSVNTMHDSLTPLGGLAALVGMLAGEVIFGGVGCGLYGILIYVLITVFIAGLMVGRTPEYLGKKVESYEIKLAVIAQLLYPACVLGLSAVSLLVPAGARSLSASGPHGLTQIIYAYASAAANNGSSFAGLAADAPFPNVMLGLTMLVGRFGVILPVLAIAGSFAAKKTVPASPGTFPTTGFTFVLLLTGVIMAFGGLTYFPALALGPVAEHLSFLHPEP